MLSQDLSVIEQIAAFDIPLDVREKVKGVLGKLETQYPDSTEFQKVVRFVRLCAGYYLPFVELTRPVLEGESILVRHGVDVYQHDTDLSLWERIFLRFALWSRAAGPRCA